MDVTMERAQGLIDEKTKPMLQLELMIIYQFKKELVDLDLLSNGMECLSM
jgi:hypothetical protein